MFIVDADSMMDISGGFTGMLDRSRVILCVFMLTLVIVNPFNILISDMAAKRGQDDFGHSSVNMRTLQGVEGCYIASEIVLLVLIFFIQCLIHLFNSLIEIMILAVFNLHSTNANASVKL